MIKGSLSHLNLTEIELKMPVNQLQDSVGRVNQSLEHTQSQRTTVEILSSMSRAVLMRAVNKLKFQETIHQSAVNALDKVTLIKEGAKRFNNTLQEANRIVEAVNSTHTHTRQTEEVYIHLTVEL